MRWGGESPRIIEFLLGDSRQWNTLRTDLQQHLLKLKELLNTFKSHGVLYKELTDADDGQKKTEESSDDSDSGGGNKSYDSDDNDDEPSPHQDSTSQLSTDKQNLQKINLGDLKAIKQLSSKIASFGEERTRALAGLDRETKEMIKLVNILSQN